MRDFFEGGRDFGPHSAPLLQYESGAVSRLERVD